MSRFKPDLKTYTRPIPAGWWWQTPFLLRYMLREWSSLFVVAYALVLLSGVYSLSQGEASYDAWRRVIASPPLVVFHLIALLVLVYHSYTWFKVMPKTTPHIPIDPKVITYGGIAVVAFISVAAVAIGYWVMS